MRYSLPTQISFCKNITSGNFVKACTKESNASCNCVFVCRDVNSCMQLVKIGFWSLIMNAKRRKYFTGRSEKKGVEEIRLVQFISDRHLTLTLQDDNNVCQSISVRSEILAATRQTGGKPHKKPPPIKQDSWRQSLNSLRRLRNIWGVLLQLWLMNIQILPQVSSFYSFEIRRKAFIVFLSGKKNGAALLVAVSPYIISLFADRDCSVNLP